MKCDAVVLAAGKGERLWPFTVTQAKPAIRIVGRPLIHYILDFLRFNGVRKVCVVVDYRKEDVVDAVNSFGIRARYVEQGDIRGTGAALLSAEKYVSDEFLVANGDILLLRRVKMPPQSILLVNRPHNGEFGTPIVNNGILADVREKEPGDAINGGVYHLDSCIFDLLRDAPLSTRGELEITSVLPRLGLRAVYVPDNGWMDVGRPWDLIRASARVLTLLPERRDGEVESRATLKGKVVVEEGAEIRNGAYIRGPAYVGSGAVVGPNAYVRPNSVICRNARVGNAVEVKASVLMAGAHVSHLSYVGDSVVGRNANLGAGTITANLRFDEKPVRGVSRKMGAFIGDGVRTGVHVSLMPGVRIGPHAWIFPGSVVYSDVPAGDRVSGIYRRGQ